MVDEQDDDRHRLDRWLWFTRFFKSRSLATQAVTLGRVMLNGNRVKPAHEVRVGDRITLTMDRDAREITVRDLPSRRGPAPEAQACYAESEASIARRESARAERRLADLSHPRTLQRPDKRERRQLARFRGR